MTVGLNRMLGAICATLYLRGERCRQANVLGNIIRFKHSIAYVNCFVSEVAQTMEYFQLRAINDFFSIEGFA
ncbi:hypothetical protein BDD21_3207 [Thiocapsa rosea]|uniref:Uncharacterized protein n=1 Tax=Thiocapsa rosea TaxID=69360 RepID=A0A495VBA9_9GAMM|nr:hypothetical protein BDD21_3207 [Thiocapsa rosea]